MSVSVIDIALRNPKRGFGFIPFITAGDPDKEATLDLLLMLAGEGADVIELGIPFSDPVADGPVIQASSQRALDNESINVRDVLEVVSRFRVESEVPVVLFGYLNPILNYGVEKFATDASEAGANGVLITDVIDEEFSSLQARLAVHGLDLIPLIAPTTSAERIARIVTDATGFVYVISMKGVTGSAAVTGNEVTEIVQTIREHSDIPVAVGFGISDRESLNAVGRYADAGVVGSALIRSYEGAPRDQCVAKARSFVRALLE